MMVKSTCNNINVLKKYHEVRARAREYHYFIIVLEVKNTKHVFSVRFQNVNFDRNPDRTANRFEFTRTSILLA